MQDFTFIDLFAGLGGFHVALEKIGGKCVFASEINPTLRALYETNFTEKNTKHCDFVINGDIHAASVPDIPKHDLLCAGFPCQPFSKAGKRKGLKDPENGNHFCKIMEILDYHTPKYFILENVPNLKGHDNGKTWEIISNRLSVRYEISQEILSPHQFGVPQHRKRIYVVGALKANGGLNGWNIRVPSYTVTDLNKVLETGTNFSYQPVKDETMMQLEVWEEFIHNLKNHKIPSFPIWTMEFGANYPYESLPPIKFPPKELARYRGAFGKRIDYLPLDQVLPRYARIESEFPNWKVNYIRRNREFYDKHKGWLKNWITKIQDWDFSHQKFEWNAGRELPTLKDKVIQYRPSGIRVKRKDTAPALVLSKTQVPIIWDQKMNIFRYINIKEAARLQSLESLSKLPETDTFAYRALGNAVNSEVVRKIIKDLLNNTIPN